MSSTAGVVALLFTDVVGSTEVLDRLGDRAADRLRQAHFALLRRAVAETGGDEVKSLGDGLMVVFGSPRRALECAVRMQEAVAGHNRAHPGGVLQVRVGVHAGEPIADSDDYHGSAVVIAKRLCDQARGGQILASELVSELAGGRREFRLRPAGRLKLKGLVDLVPAVTVEWAPAASPAAEPRPPAPSSSPRDPVSGPPLIGREQELARFEAAMAQVAEGRGRVMFIIGDMGMGKTRLAEEALVIARARDWLVLVGRSPAAGSGLAYAPLLSAFGSVLRRLETWWRDALVGDLLHLGRLWPELGLPPPAPVGDPDLERTLLFEGVSRLIERLAADRPVVLFVDDLHWADTSSLSLLGYLIPALAELPVLLVGAYRPEGLADSKALRQLVASASRSGLAADLALRSLDREEVAVLAAGILGDAAPVELIDLAARAAGTPLFVEALVRGLLDSGALVRSGDGWTLVGRLASTLPRGVRDLVVSRLDLLDPEERSTLELIAQGPQGLPHDLVEVAGGLDTEAVLEIIGHLVGAGLVVQESDGPEITYRLAHPLFQEVAAGELPTVAGRRQHARLARAVENCRPGDLDRLAYHYSRAGREVDVDRALDVLLQAGERARSLSAHNEAARHFEASLTLIRDGHRPDLLADVLERLGASWEPLGETAAAMEVWTEAVSERQRVGDAPAVARLCRRLGLAARDLGDADAARRHLAAGVDALREQPPSEELVDLHHARLLVDSPLFHPDRAGPIVAELSRLARMVESPRALVDALSGEGALHMGRGDFDLAVGKAAEALRLAQETGDPILMQRAHRDAAWVLWFAGDFDACRQNAEAWFQHDRQLGAPAQVLLSRFMFILLDLLSGEWDGLVGRAEEVIDHARRLAQRRVELMMLGGLGLIHTLRGDLDLGERYLSEARSLGQDMAGDRALYFVWWPEAVLAFERGDLAALHSIAGQLRHPAAWVIVGAAQVAEGDLDGALATANGMAAKAAPGSFAGAMADRIFGLIAGARGDAEEARHHQERSAEALTALGTPFEAAVSRLHTGTVDNVTRALATFESLGAALYADRARRALRQLGVRPASPRRGRDSSGPLSRRELEVARLVAEGLTNAEMAERLVLSVRTVESHLDHIYGRLGLSSRAALVKWVVTTDLGDSKVT